MAVTTTERTRPRVGRRDPVFLELLAKFYRGLGDPTRLRILEYLLEGEKSVSELVDLLGSAQGRVSSHLACLRQCGYAVVRAEGRHAYYRIADPRVVKILSLGQTMVQENAKRIFACTRISS
jgi:ArsR family transcriptional regulator, cadmium/lead-responsive transcriptional repressor